MSAEPSKVLKNLAMSLADIRNDLQPLEEKMKPIKDKEKKIKKDLLEEMKRNKKVKRIFLRNKGYKITHFDRDVTPRVTKEVIETIAIDYIQKHGGTLTAEKLSEVFVAWRTSSSKRSEGLRVVALSDAEKSKNENEEEEAPPLNLFDDNVE
jgi:uncharacterized coiled-coil protein SlyX